MADLSVALPIIGPLLADPEIRKFLLVLVVLVGVPMRDIELDEDGKKVVRWHFRGAFRIAWTAAHGIYRGSERLDRLEAAVIDLVKVVRERIPKHPDHTDTIRPAAVSDPAIVTGVPLSRRS
jgi:hypothetical protein